MIVALRHMLEQLPTGEVVNLLPGDEVKTFSSWPYQNKVSALSARMVTKVDDKDGERDVGALLTHPPDPAAKAEVDAEHGWDKRPRVALLPPELRIEVAPATEVAPEVEDPKGTPAQDAADELLLQEDPELAKALGLVKKSCDLCDYAGSEQGLKIHKARVHKPR